MLEKFVEDRYRKSLKECSNEEGKSCKEKEGLLYFGRILDWKIIVE